MDSNELYVLGIALALIGITAAVGVVALVAEWLLPGLATHPTFNRVLLGRIEGTRANRVLMSLNFIVTAIFFALAVNLMRWPALVAFLAWLPLAVWAVRAAWRSRAPRAA